MPGAGEERAAVRAERVRLELVRLLRLAFRDLDELRAFLTRFAPAALASWRISLPAAAAPERPVRGQSWWARLRRTRASSPAGTFGRPSLDAPARELCELLVADVVRRGAEHALLDALGAEHSYLVDEIVATRTLLAGDEPKPRSSKVSRPKRAARPTPPPVAFADERRRDVPGHETLTTGKGSATYQPAAAPAPGSPHGPYASKGISDAFLRDAESVGAESVGAESAGAESAGDSPDDVAHAAGERRAMPPQIVSVGFANRQDPSAILVNRTLAVDEDCLFWLDIAPELSPHSLGGAEPMHGLAEGDIIDVVVFGFPGQLQLGDERHGRIRLALRGNHVLAPAWPHAREAPRMLYFAVRTPSSPGKHALRCNLYCRGLLLQSHLVTAEVTAHPREQRQPARRVVDYNLTASLDTARLGERSTCTASLLLNDDGKGTHSFRFVSSNAGVPEQIAEGHVDGVKLVKEMRYARQALRFAAWGKSEPWTRDDEYLLDDPKPEHLRQAWLRLAKRGANLWVEIAAAFDWLGPQALALREKMRAPGTLQIALMASPDAVLPASLIYDYPIDTALSELRVCEAATTAIRQGRDLAGEPCFRGQCPSYHAPDVVCPGGFWGFRHDLGLPIHLPKGEVAQEIPCTGPVRAFAAISTDPAFVQRDRHLAELAGMIDGGIEILRDRSACLARLDEERHLVYFYCHGGLMPESDTPFLQVGSIDSDPLLAQSLHNAAVSWEHLRPLVVLNGCHTTAASPDEMFNMLSAFAAHCNAAGVIGTEITNFEPVAVAFGAELVRRFVRGEPIGAAIRHARLALLRTGNPLGLMYVPYAIPSLHLNV